VVQRLLAHLGGFFLAVHPIVTLGSPVWGKKNPSGNHCTELEEVPAINAVSMYEVIRDDQAERVVLIIFDTYRTPYRKIVRLSKQMVIRANGL
jgi:hypothetical protein